MASRAKDWLAQALRDLEHARRAAADGFHEWACFSAQQAAEKAAKAVYHHLAGEAWGHSVKNLLDGLTDRFAVPKDVVDCGRILDHYHIPTRYPHGFDEGKPADYYASDDSQKAIRCAEAVLRFCEGILAGSGEGSA